MTGKRRVRIGPVYVFRPVILDVVYSQHHQAQDGDRVRVVKLHGAPPPGVMGQCHIVDADTGIFMGMVSVHSLQAK